MTEELPTLYIDSVDKVYVNKLSIEVDIIEKIKESLREIGNWFEVLFNNLMGREK